MPELIRTEPQPHDAAEELLPWYATGQLDEPERIRVEEHLSSCSGCREQLAVERRLIHEFRGQAPEVDAGWTRLRHRIEDQRKPPRHQPRSAAGLRDLIRRPALAALAAAQLAFVVIAGGALLSLSRPSYHALGSAPVAQSGNVLVIFRADATVADIRDALHASGASIVGGPTSADAYLLRVPQQQRKIALAKLKADNQVQLAEPVDGPAQ
jgi:anti-sigma factor RsiW